MHRLNVSPYFFVELVLLNCLFPVSDDQEAHKYPVLVFIHGESYEWNAGSTYDGSVLASYGKVVVVTINFRLGILGNGF